MSVARAAEIWPAVPASVSVAVPFAPAPSVAPPAARLTVSAPLVTVSRVVARLPSTSTTPTLNTLATVNASVVSSASVALAGAVFTGASFTGVTVTVTVAVSIAPPEVTV